ncbi:MAG: hypothetical protein RL226_2190 [Bacteroidota bacterium]|jgi:23S rRNA (cytidine1920-2'-O)/16S rRNA (cytidine1409-2'-O)-methyltransferase
MTELHRLDQLLVAKKLVNSRQRAEVLIKEGGVQVNGKIIDKPGRKFDLEADIALVMEPMQWVSRGALKLIAAIEAWRLADKIRGARCLDIGASTGGFTQVLLAYGAEQVVALDTGHGQLASVLANDPRVINLEKHNVRHTPTEVVGKAEVIVIDVSFISLCLVLPEVLRFMSEDACVIALVKPQFEVGPALLGRNGIVQRESDRYRALENVKKSAVNCGLKVVDAIDSPIKGGDGNREFLILLK